MDHGKVRAKKAKLLQESQDRDLENSDEKPQVTAKKAEREMMKNKKVVAQTTLDWAEDTERVSEAEGSKHTISIEANFTITSLKNSLVNLIP